MAGAGARFDVDFEADIDRWNCGFNLTPGTRIGASAFGFTDTLCEFDDRDGRIVVGFETSATSNMIAPSTTQTLDCSFHQRGTDDPAADDNGDNLVGGADHGLLFLYFG